MVRTMAALLGGAACLACSESTKAQARNEAGSAAPAAVPAATQPGGLAAEGKGLSITLA